MQYDRLFQQQLGFVLAENVCCLSYDIVDLVFSAKMRLNFVQSCIIWNTFWGLITFQGHPRSSMMALIKSPYMQLYISDH